MFSDGLDVERCVELKAASDEAGIGCSFGVGTFLTNGKYLLRIPSYLDHSLTLALAPTDFKRVASPIHQPTESLGAGEVLTDGDKSTALNMVIKLFKINDKFCVKISDELTKTTGDDATVQLVKDELKLGAWRYSGFAG